MTAAQPGAEYVVVIKSSYPTERYDKHEANEN